MQQFNAQPQFNSPYTPAGSGTVSPNMAAQPKLGTPVPGTTGGLPAKPGLSVFNNPLPQQLQSQPDNPPMQQTAQQMQQYGRGDDSVLVHMTPDEVNSLQGLAVASGGSLTINPHTGLPEAGWLGRLLPMLAGLGLNFLLPGSGIVASLGGKAVTAGLMTGLGTAAITGDLKEGLMAGLGAYGGASLGGGLKQALGAGAKTAATTAAPQGLNAAGQAIANTGSIAAPVAPAQVAANLLPSGIGPVIPGTSFADAFPSAFAAPATAVTPAAAAIPTTVAPTVAPAVADTATQAVKTGVPGFFQGFANTARGPMTGMLGKVAPIAAGMGVMNSLSGSGQVKDQQSGAVDNSYEGPYYTEPRQVSFAPSTQDILSSSKERTYFTPSIPGIFNAAGQLVQPGSNTPAGTMIRTPVLNPNAKKGQPMYSYVDRAWMTNAAQQPVTGYYAHGGQVHMDDGSFVMPARETAEFGKGSTDAGQSILAGLGGIPIKGRGDGTSDSIPASIGGQKARVADGEVHFPRSAVERIGGGDHKRGTKKLYDLMAKAEQSRKKAARGGDGINLSKGLASL